MNNCNLEIKGIVTVLNKEIPEIYGGFGDNQKVILVKSVATLHERPLKKLNELIRGHIDDGYFEDSIDFVDLKNSPSEGLFEKLGFSNRDIIISSNIYLLSQQGYSLLLKLMNTPKARDEYKTVIRDYFSVKNELNELKRNHSETLRRFQELSDIEKDIEYLKSMKKIYLLEDKVEEYKPHVELLNKMLKTHECIDFLDVTRRLQLVNFGRNKLFRLLREKNILMSGIHKNMPYQQYAKYFAVVQGFCRQTGEWIEKTVLRREGYLFLYKILKENDIVEVDMDYEEFKNKLNAEIGNDIPVVKVS